MCGRTACTLAKCCLIKACRYETNNNSKKLPEWRDVCTDRQYYPNFNLAPTSLSPVVISKSLLDKNCGSDDRLICPMRWGLIPPWHKENPKEFSFKTINCRAETILEKSTYSRPLQKGKRCVILADGFFEWKRDEDPIQPYFIYFPQKKKMESTADWSEHSDSWWNEKKGWSGRRLLTMAGIFDVCSTTETELYSYSVVTVEAAPEFAWIHDRMPAILDGEDAIARWLDYERVPHDEALELLRPISNVEWHPVSSVVNNSRNHVIECVLPITLQPKKAGESSMMMNWLRSAPSSSSSSKKFKTEKE